MTDPLLPASQRELLLAVRGDESQDAFARRLGIDRSCLSRYERERLGVPINVLNYCLKAMAGTATAVASSPVDRALSHVRHAADVLQELSKSSPRVRRAPRRKSG